MKDVSKNILSARGLRGHRGFAITACVLTGSSAIAAQAGQPAKNAQDTTTFSFSIPAGPLQAVLAEFQRVTGMKVVLSEPAIGNLQSPGISGSMTASRALDAAIYNTGAAATVTQGSARLDLKKLTESISVSGEVKVASPKFTQPLRDTPQVIAVIPQQVFNQQGASTLRDVLRNTPGVTMSIGEGGSGGTSSGDNVLIRGFSARNDIYIDGTRDVGLVNRDSFNIESVEVAKGPSSVTAGRGATGGSINLVTKSASLFNSGSIQVTGGTADDKRTTVDVNRALNQSTAFRFNGMWQDAGYAGRDVAKNKRWGVAPSIALGLGSPTQVTLNYSHTEENNIPDWGIPTLLPDVAIANHVTVNDLNFSNFYGIASRDYEKTKSDIGTATITHKFNANLRLRNLTRYGKNYREAVLTPPRPATTAAGQGPGDPGYDATKAQIRRTDTKYQRRNDRVITNQTDLTTTFKTGELQHSVDAGLEITRDSQPTTAFTDLFTNGRPPVDDLFNPTPYVAYTPAYANTGASTDAHATTNAGYIFDTIKFKNVQADLGIRQDHVEATYASTATTGVVTNFARKDNATSGRAALVYKPTTQSSIYAAYSTSFVPSFDGTLGLTLAATGVNSQALEPEKTRNAEVGAKLELTHMMFSASLFQIEKTNAKTTDLTGATVLAGDQRVRGIELNATGNVTSRLAIFGGISVMSGEVVSSGIATEVGAQLPYVPHVSFNMWSSYELPMRLTIGAGVNYESGHYFNQTGSFNFVGGGTVANTKYAENASAIQSLTKFWLVNAMASYPVTSHVKLQVNLNNIGNTRYADRAYDRHFLPGQTRQLIVTPVITW